MENAFQIEHLDADRLLVDWRWLCPEPVELIARNDFGDLFLRTGRGKILWLDVALGNLTEVADSVQHFRQLLEDEQNREAWLAESDATNAANRGFRPDVSQCIGFATPTIFAESGHANNAYIADLYEYVGFLGHLHEQISTLPDGAKVRLQVVPTDSQDSER